MSPRLELFCYFSVGLLFTLIFPSLFSFKIYYFIPFLIRCYYLKSWNTSLIMALGIGFITDLFSAHSRFGLYSANYVITTYFLYGLKRNFFEDHLTTLPVMTLFFSILSTWIHYLLILLLDSTSPSLSFSFILVDFLLMPLMDSLFALFLFALPLFFFGKPIKKGTDYFLEHER